MTIVHDSKLAIGAILSSQELINTISGLAKVKFDRVSVELVCGLNESIAMGKEMESRGIDVIISRRGTAELLRENLHIPVLALMANPLDILISMKRAVMFGKQIFITTFRKQLTGMEILEEIFNVSIMQGIYYDDASLEQVIVDARDKGADVIIGGGVSMKFAHKYGCEGVRFYISEEAVAFAIEDALSVARLYRQEQEKSKRYECIIDSTADAIVSVNRMGIMTTINRAAKELFNIEDDHSGTGRHALIDYLPQSNFRKIFDAKQPMTNKLEKIKGELFLTNHIPISINSEIVGIVSIFRHTAAVIKDENEVRRNFAKGFVAHYTIDDIIHASPVMRDVVRKAKRYASSDSTILINGETGTGKEIIAQSIHNMGRRAKGPFVSINCAALPEQLLENELFGHEEGAFTGSRKGGKIGLFELAHNGTIFLDEIASTSPSVQASLLRVLQEKKVMRIGSDRLIPIDVRVLAASNKDLIEEVRSGRFREDLFFRLNVLIINMPPLRERIEDIVIIAADLMKRISEKCGLEPISIPESSIRKLMRYEWPGNVRQLENFLERLLLLSDSVFDPGIFHELFQEIETHNFSRRSLPERMVGHVGREKRGDGQETLIDEVLLDAKFCKKKAAQMLGISRTTLWRKMKTP
ncbi:MAG: sigma 54-interacting transcriptional regulator [Pseudomonadota bacterium]